MHFFKRSKNGYGYFWRTLINSIILHFTCKTMKQNIIDRINHLANEKGAFPICRQLCRFGSIHTEAVGNSHR